MTETPDATRTLPPDRPVEPARERWTDRSWPLSVLVAVALAALLVGGLVGALIANAGDNQMPMYYRDGPGMMHRDGKPVPPGQWHKQGPRWQEPRG